MKSGARIVLFGSDIEAIQATAPVLVTSAISGASVLLGTVPLALEGSYLPIVTMDAAYVPTLALEGKSQ